MGSARMREINQKRGVKLQAVLTKGQAEREEGPPGIGRTRQGFRDISKYSGLRMHLSLGSFAAAKLGLWSGMLLRELPRTASDLPSYYP